MRKIGIFTAFQPYVPLGEDGLGRLMLYMIKGMLENGDSVTIIAPSWHRKVVKSFLKDNLLEKNVKLKSIRLFPPVLLWIYDFIYEWRRKRELQEDTFFWRDVRNFFREMLFSLLASYSPLLFAFYMVVLFALSIIGLPFVLLSFMIKLIKKLCERFKLKKILDYFARVPRKMRSYGWIIGIMNAARRYEVRKMVKYVNRSDIEYWYIPSIFWPETVKIKKKRALVAPDLVYSEFSQLYYVDEPICWNAEIIDKILKKRPKLVCYSNYVADRQLSQLRDIPRQNIAVVPHGVMDLSEHLKMGLNAKEIVDVFLRKKNTVIPNFEYVKTFPFGDSDFLFYTSQCRYHKNIPLLIQVFEKLLRREHRNLKLVLTCANYELLKDQLEKLNLQRDVIFMPRIPEAVMAALNALARIHVNPSLFEGAFPFTFGEAFSVGTPSVMADIPVTREIVTDESLAEKMLFDPYDEEDMIKRICWALDNRDELIEAQRPLFEKLSQRTWAVVADEYVRSMRYSCERKMPKRRVRKWKRS